ncbi:hypothetical protein TDB9533_04814 [Thalassocella blandensis]|nr:hypothetical protein TDB9533_04814 [Thalassocella blandensis]
MPSIVTASDSAVALKATSSTLVNEKASGVVSAAKVVTLKSPVTPPIFNVAVVAVEKFDEDVSLTFTLSPFATEPSTEVKSPSPMAYSPPVILIGASSLMPDTVIASSDSNKASKGTSVRAAKAKGSGVVSCATEVIVNVSVTVPTVTPTITSLENSDEATPRKVNVSPSLITPSDDENAPLLMEYSPSVIVTATETLISSIVTELESTVAPSETSVAEVKVKDAGVLSSG